MVSLWWVVAAFIAGSYAGLFVMALLRMSSDVEQRPARRPAKRRAIRNTSWSSAVGRQARVAI